MSKDIKQTVNFNCSPKELFQLMTNSALHARLTGKPAEVSKKEGAKIKSYGRWVEGMNVVVKENKELTQAWRGKDWPKGLYSVVQFTFQRNEDKTKMVMTQTGIPDKHADEIKEGWKTHYWDPIRTFLKQQKASKRKAA